MDFGDLLHMAQKNSQNQQKNESSKFYSTKFAPPKKESKDKKLSSNIQKFLAKREEEEREKARLARQKRDALLAMRDTKAKNKINKMLKTIKSANKSVLDDAIDHQDTAVTLEGPDQPDEDDYGYTSQEATALYSKLMDKYKSVPEDKKYDFSKKALSKDEMKSTKDRVKAAIVREQEEENLPHRRQRQSKSSSEIKSEHSRDKSPKPNSYFYNEPEPQPEKPKVKKKPPPPPAMDFKELLKLAEQKQFEPIKIETPKVQKEPERLMTHKEKAERRAYLEEQERRKLKRENGGKAPPTAAAAPTPNKMEPNGRIPKLNNGSSISKDNRIPKTNGKTEVKPSMKPGSNSQSNQSMGPPAAKVRKIDPSNNNNSSTSKLYGALTKPSGSSQNISRSTNSSTSSQNPRKQNDQDRISTSSTKSSMDSSTSKKSAITQQPSKSSASTSTTVIKSKAPQKVPEKTRDFPPKDTNIKKTPLSAVKPRQFPPADVKTRKFPPDDVRGSSSSGSREFPPRDVQRSKKPPPPKRRVIESDEDSEYDSEMDDFIDDGPLEDPSAVSSLIRDIFGYDKSRYRDEDFDDRQMESSFAQQMREEFVSKKIGLMEDLEDMRQEALEKQRKANKLKTKKR